MNIPIFWQSLQRISLTSILCLCLMGCSEQNAAQTTSSDIEALTATLTGEFDSGQQMREDLLNKVDKKDAHFWVNRIFVKPETTHMPDPVLVGSTRYSAPWTFDDNEFLVWSFTPHPDSAGILMSPNRFKDLEALKPFARDAEKLSGFGPDDLEAAISGASCDIIWTRSETGFSGRSKPCSVMSTTQNKILNWVWTYDLTDDALYVAFAGEDENGETLDGTPEGKPYRLDRLADNAEYTNGRDILFNPTSREDIGKAVELLELATSDYPDHAASKIALTYGYLRQNKYAEAGSTAEKAKAQIEQLSSQDKLWLEALEARIADDYPREISAWEKVLETDPQDRWALYELASMYYRSSDYPKTVQTVEAALKAEPDEAQWGASFIYYLHSKSLYRMGKLTEAITAAEPGVRNVNTRRATYYRKAMAQIATGDITDPAEALQTYYDYSKRNGTVNEASYKTSVALFFFELGDYDKAVKSAREGYDLSKGVYQSWALGYALTEQGQAAKGLDIINEALTRFPDHVNLLAGKGWAHYRLGEMDKANASMLAAQTASPRKNSGVERDLKIIQQALRTADTPPVPPVRWFGD